MLRRSRRLRWILFWRGFLEGVVFVCRSAGVVPAGAPARPLCERCFLNVSLALETFPKQRSPIVLGFVAAVSASFCASLCRICFSISRFARNIFKTIPSERLRCSPKNWFCSLCSSELFVAVAVKKPRALSGRSGL